MRRYDENVARKDQAGALCRLQTVESRIAILNATLGQYDQAARDELLAGGSAGVLGRYARVTADIRKELARLEDERRLESGILLHCEAALLDAHRARKSADQHHRRVVRMIALKRAAELDNQAGAASSPYADGPYDSLEQTDVY
ncbi:MAG: hypothetical protein QGH94_18165 [Phycisphaerae bacterium]|jgi:hypothetical protein|nr:hypothetical protein [Phycisphaerae bacterium]MDP7289912.1 hypothetical protein [Phycisphaerae bacterium]